MRGLAPKSPHPRVIPAKAESIPDALPITATIISDGPGLWVTCGQVMQPTTMLPVSAPSPRGRGTMTWWVGQPPGGQRMPAPTAARLSTGCPPPTGGSRHHPPSRPTRLRAPGRAVFRRFSAVAAADAARGTVSCCSEAGDYGTAGDRGLHAQARRGGPLRLPTPSPIASASRGPRRRYSSTGHAALSLMRISASSRLPGTARFSDDRMLLPRQFGGNPGSRPASPAPACHSHFICTVLR